MTYRQDIGFYSLQAANLKYLQLLRAHSMINPFHFTHKQKPIRSETMFLLPPQNISCSRPFPLIKFSVAIINFLQTYHDIPCQGGFASPNQIQRRL